MNIRHIALLSSLVVLTACSTEEIDYYSALVKGDPLPAADLAELSSALETYAAGSAQIAEIIEADAAATSMSSSEEPVEIAAVEPEPEPPRYVLIQAEGGPMGEDIATGADCVPQFRARICI